MEGSGHTAYLSLMRLVPRPPGLLRRLLTAPAAATLLALMAGLGLGAGLLALRSPLLEPVLAVAAPVTALWVNAIRATVIPLVVSLLVASVASAPDARAVGRLGGRALALFVAMLAVAALLVALVVPPLLARLPLGGASALGATSGGGAPALPPAAPLPGPGEWLAALVPVNPVAAAASGALLPLVVFALLFALAARRLAPAARLPVVALFGAIADAMLVLVRWILALAPAGVFALAVALGARAGAGAAGALALFVALVAATCVALLVPLYALAVVAGRVPLGRFARAAAPAQAIAFSTRSSLAALPALVAGAAGPLAAPAAVTGFLLPLAVSTFKLGVTIAVVTSTVFLARLYGVALAPGQLAAVAASSVLLSFSVPGVPGGVILVIAPVLASVGIPAEGVGVLLAIDVIPDMFRTLTNVTADAAAAAVLSRGERDTKDR